MKKCMKCGGSHKYAKGGSTNLKPIPAGNKGLPMLSKDVRNKMGYMAGGGYSYACGGQVGDRIISGKSLRRN
jgi:hypothetical protein